MQKFEIRPASEEDVEDMHRLIGELARFERAPQEFILSKEQLKQDGFTNQAKYVCFVAVVDGQVQGMSLCYIRYSTWKGVCLYLEDLIVTESLRGQGIGKALLDYTLAYARQNHFYKLQWQVLDWNESAINFYKKYKAEFDSSWLNVSIVL